MEFLLAWALAWVFMGATKRVRDEFTHATGRHSADLRRDHPDWSPRRVSGHARARTLARWGHEAGGMFPTFRQAWGDHFLVARTELEEARANGVKTRRELLDRLEAAKQKRLEAKGTGPEPGTAGPAGTVPAAGDTGQPGTMLPPGIVPEPVDIPRPGTARPGTRLAELRRQRAALDHAEPGAEGAVRQLDEMIAAEEARVTRGSDGAQAPAGPSPAPPAVPGARGSDGPRSGAHIPGVHERGDTPWDITRVGTLAVDGRGNVRMNGWEFVDPHPVADGNPATVRTHGTGATQGLHGHTLPELHAMSHGPDCRCAVTDVKSAQAGGTVTITPGDGGQPVPPPPAPGTGPGSTNGSGGHMSENTATADTEIGDSPYDAMRGAAGQLAESAERTATQVGDDMRAVAVKNGFGRDQATMAEIAEIEDAYTTAAARAKALKEGLAARHNQGDEYHGTGQDAHAEAFRPA